MLCDKCGATQSDDAKFCSNCATPLKSTTPIAAVTEKGQSPSVLNATLSTEDVAKAIIGAACLGLGVYWLWNIDYQQFFGGSSVQTALTEAVRQQDKSASGATQTLLETVTTLEHSTRADLRKLIDEGGIDRHPAWNGLYVSRATTFYYGNNTLAFYRLQIHGKAEWHGPRAEWLYAGIASPKEVRETLTKVCRVPAGSWTVDESGGRANRGVERTADYFVCRYDRKPDSNDVDVSIGSPTNAGL